MTSHPEDFFKSVTDPANTVRSISHQYWIKDLVTICMQITNRCADDKYISALNLICELTQGLNTSKIEVLLQDPSQSINN